MGFINHEFICNSNGINQYLLRVNVPRNFHKTKLSLENSVLRILDSILSTSKSKESPSIKTHSFTLIVKKLKKEEQLVPIDSDSKEEDTKETQAKTRAEETKAEKKAKGLYQIGYQKTTEALPTFLPLEGSLSDTINKINLVSLNVIKRIGFVAHWHRFMTFQNKASLILLGVFCFIISPFVALYRTFAEFRKERANLDIFQRLNAEDNFNSLLAGIQESLALLETGKESPSDNVVIRKILQDALQLGNRMKATQYDTGLLKQLATTEASNILRKCKLLTEEKHNASVIIPCGYYRGKDFYPMFLTIRREQCDKELNTESVFCIEKWTSDPFAQENSTDKPQCYIYTRLDEHMLAQLLQQAFLFTKPLSDVALQLPKKVQDQMNSLSQLNQMANLGMQLESFSLPGDANLVDVAESFDKMLLSCGGERRAINPYETINEIRDPDKTTNPPSAERYLKEVGTNFNADKAINRDPWNVIGHFYKTWFEHTPFGNCSWLTLTVTRHHLNLFLSNFHSFSREKQQKLLPKLDSEVSRLISTLNTSFGQDVDSSLFTSFINDLQEEIAQIKRMLSQTQLVAVTDGMREHQRALNTPANQPISLQIDPGVTTSHGEFEINHSSQNELQDLSQAIAKNDFEASSKHFEHLNKILNDLVDNKSYQKAFNLSNAMLHVLPVPITEKRNRFEVLINSLNSLRYSIILSIETNRSDIETNRNMFAYLKRNFLDSMQQCETIERNWFNTLKADISLLNSRNQASEKELESKDLSEKLDQMLTWIKQDEAELKAIKEKSINLFEERASLNRTLLAIEDSIKQKKKRLKKLKTDLPRANNINQQRARIESLTHEIEQESESIAPLQKKLTDLEIAFETSKMLKKKYEEIGKRYGEYHCLPLLELRVNPKSLYKSVNHVCGDSYLCSRKRDFCEDNQQMYEKINLWKEQLKTLSEIVDFLPDPMLKDDWDDEKNEKIISEFNERLAPIIANLKYPFKFKDSLILKQDAKPDNDPKGFWHHPSIEDSALRKKWIKNIANVSQYLWESHLRLGMPKIWPENRFNLLLGRAILTSLIQQNGTASRLKMRNYLTECIENAKQNEEGRTHADFLKYRLRIDINRNITYQLARRHLGQNAYCFRHMRLNVEESMDLLVGERSSDSEQALTWIDHDPYQLTLTPELFLRLNTLRSFFLDQVRENQAHLRHTEWSWFEERDTSELSVDCTTLINGYHAASYPEKPKHLGGIVGLAREAKNFVVQVWKHYKQFTEIDFPQETTNARELARNQRNLRVPSSFIALRRHTMMMECLKHSECALIIPRSWTGDLAQAYKFKRQADRIGRHKSVKEKNELVRDMYRNEVKEQLQRMPGRLKIASKWYHLGPAIHVTSTAPRGTPGANLEAVYQPHFRIERNINLYDVQSSEAISGNMPDAFRNIIQPRFGFQANRRQDRTYMNEYNNPNFWNPNTRDSRTARPETYTLALAIRNGGDKTFSPMENYGLSTLQVGINNRDAAFKPDIAYLFSGPEESMNAIFQYFDKMEEESVQRAIAIGLFQQGALSTVLSDLNGIKFFCIRSSFLKNKIEESIKKQRWKTMAFLMFIGNQIQRFAKAAKENIKSSEADEKYAEESPEATLHNQLSVLLNDVPHYASPYIFRKDKDGNNVTKLGYEILLRLADERSDEITQKHLYTFILDWYSRSDQLPDFYGLILYGYSLLKTDNSDSGIPILQHALTMHVREHLVPKFLSLPKETQNRLLNALNGYATDKQNVLNWTQDINNPFLFQSGKKVINLHTGSIRNVDDADTAWKEPQSEDLAARPQITLSYYMRAQFWLFLTYQPPKTARVMPSISDTEACFDFEIESKRFRIITHREDNYRIAIFRWFSKEEVDEANAGWYQHEKVFGEDPKNAELILQNAGLWKKRNENQRYLVLCSVENIRKSDLLNVVTHRGRISGLETLPTPESIHPMIVCNDAKDKYRSTISFTTEENVLFLRRHDSPVPTEIRLLNEGIILEKRQDRSWILSNRSSVGNPKGSIMHWEIDPSKLLPLSRGIKDIVGETSSNLMMTFTNDQPEPIDYLLVWPFTLARNPSTGKPQAIDPINQEATLPLKITVKETLSGETIESSCNGFLYLAYLSQYQAIRLINEGEVINSQLELERAAFYVKKALMTPLPTEESSPGERRLFQKLSAEIMAMNPPRNAAELLLPWFSYHLRTCLAIGKIKRLQNIESVYDSQEPQIFLTNREVVVKSFNAYVKCLDSLNKQRLLTEYESRMILNATEEQEYLTCRNEAVTYIVQYIAEQPKFQNANPIPSLHIPVPHNLMECAQFLPLTFTMMGPPNDIPPDLASLHQLDKDNVLKYFWHYWKQIEQNRLIPSQLPALFYATVAPSMGHKDDKEIQQSCEFARQILLARAECNFRGYDFLKDISLLQKILFIKLPEDVDSLTDLAVMAIKRYFGYKIEPLPLEQAPGVNLKNLHNLKEVLPTSLHTNWLQKWRMLRKAPYAKSAVEAILALLGLCDQRQIKTVSFIPLEPEITSQPIEQYTKDPMVLWKSLEANFSTFSKEEVESLATASQLLKDYKPSIFDLEGKSIAGFLKILADQDVYFTNARRQKMLERRITEREIRLSSTKKSNVPFSKLTISKDRIQEAKFYDVLYKPLSEKAVAAEMSQLTLVAEQLASSIRPVTEKEVKSRAEEAHQYHAMEAEENAQLNKGAEITLRNIKEQLKTNTHILQHDIYQVKTALFVRKNELTIRAKALRGTILNSINNDSPSSLKAKSKFSNVTGNGALFEHLLDLYQHNKLMQVVPLVDNSNLNFAPQSPKPEDLNSMITHFLLDATEIQQISKALSEIDKLQKASAEEQEYRRKHIAKLLREGSNCERFYGPDDFYNRKYLVAEYRQKIIFTDKQRQVIRSLTENPNQIDQRRMGDGKTKVIMPALMICLAAKYNKLCVALVTQELARMSAAHSDITTRTNFKKAGILFEFSINMPISRVSLTEQYDQLLQIIEDEDYLITTMNDIAALENKLTLVANEIHLLTKPFREGLLSGNIPPELIGLFMGIDSSQKDNKEMISKVREIITLKQIEHALRRIRELFCNDPKNPEGINAQFMADEGDEIFGAHMENNVALTNKDKPQDSLRSPDATVVSVTSTILRAICSCSEPDEKEGKLLSENGISLLLTLQKLLKGGDGRHSALPPRTVKAQMRALAEHLLHGFCKIIDKDGNETSTPWILQIGLDTNMHQILLKHSAKWIDYLTGEATKSFQKEFGVEVNQEELKIISSLKNILSTTLPNSLKQAFYVRMGLKQQNGCVVIPRHYKEEKANIQYGYEPELIVNHFLHYAVREPAEEFLKSILRKVQDHLPETYAEMAKKANGRDQILAFLKTPQAWEYRITILEKFIMKEGYISLFKEQATTPIHSLAYDKAIGTTSGTVSKPKLPEGFGPHQAESTRIVEAETYLRLGACDLIAESDRKANDAKGLNKPVTIIRDDQVMKSMIQALEDDKNLNIKSITTLVAVDKDAGSSEIISTLREITNKKPETSRQYIFVDAKGDSWIWMVNASKPITFNEETDEDKVDAARCLIFYDTKDCRGRDFKPILGKEYRNIVITGPTTNEVEYNQAACRNRAIGSLQKVEHWILTSVAERIKEYHQLKDNRDITMGLAINDLKLRSLDEDGFFNWKAAALRSSAMAFSGIRRILFSVNKDVNQSDYWLLENAKVWFLDCLVESELFEICREFMIQQKEIDFNNDFESTQMVPTLQRMGQIYNATQDKLKSLKTKIEERLNALSSLVLLPQEFTGQIRIKLQTAHQEIGNLILTLGTAKEKYEKEFEEIHKKYLTKEIASTASARAGVFEQVEQQQLRQQQQQEHQQQQVLEQQLQKTSNDISGFRAKNYKAIDMRYFINRPKLESLNDPREEDEDDEKYDPRIYQMTQFEPKSNIFVTNEVLELIPMLPTGGNPIFALAIVQDEYEFRVMWIGKNDYYHIITNKKPAKIEELLSYKYVEIEKLAFMYDWQVEIKDKKYPFAIYSIIPGLEDPLVWSYGINGTPDRSDPRCLLACAKAKIVTGMSLEAFTPQEKTEIYNWCQKLEDEKLENDNQFNAMIKHLEGIGAVKQIALIKEIRASAEDFYA